MNIFEKIYSKCLRAINMLRLALLRLRGSEIDRTVRAYGRFTVLIPENLKIGKNSTINENVHLNCRDKINIGNNVRISTSVQMHTAKLIFNVFPRTHVSAPINIGDNVWIASGSVISAGVNIGKNSIIGANSVVVNDVEADSFYAGNPAKKIKNIDKH